MAFVERRIGDSNILRLIRKWIQSSITISVTFSSILCHDDVMAKGKPRGLAGRPATGVRAGEKASAYRRLTLRLPDDTLAALDAIGRVVDRPAWRVVVDALAAYQGDIAVLSEADRRLVRGLLRRDM